VALLKPCSTSAGFTATPDPPQRIDMGRLKQALTADGYAVVVDAKIILIVRKAIPAGTLVETSLYDNGKVLVKTTDRAAAEAAYAELQPRLDQAAR